MSEQESRNQIDRKIQSLVAVHLFIILMVDGIVLYYIVVYIYLWLCAVGIIYHLNRIA